jgi:hypothetical protein
MQRNAMAGAMYPHLTNRPAPQERPRQRNLLAERIYPGLAPPKPKPVDYAREALLKNLRKLNQRVRGR